MRGRRLGSYELLDELGRGGMGAVYRARHLALGVERAVKVLPAGATPRASERFQREVQSLARIRHPRVVSVHEAGVEGSSRYFVMDLVDGENLALVLRRGPLPLERALELMIAICAGVEALHAGGVVHRDLKPDNVVVTAEGLPVVIDLGLAAAPDADRRLTRTGALVGTPVYMAPEQVRSEPATPATDVYALGLILFEVLTGLPTLDENVSLGELAQRIVTGRRQRLGRVAPDLPERLIRVYDRATAVDPAARHARAGELAAALEAVRRRPGRSRRARRRGTGAVLAAVAGLAGLAAVAVSARRSPVGPSTAAERRPPAATRDRAASLPAAPPPGHDPREGRHGRRRLERIRLLATPEQRAEAYEAWLADHPDHPEAPTARRDLAQARARFPLAALEHGPAEEEGRCVTYVRFCADGSRALSWSAAGRLVVLWDTSALPRARELWRRSLVGTGGLTVAVQPGTGRPLLSLGAELLWLREDGTTEPLPYRGPRVRCLAFAPDGRRVAVGTTRGDVLVLEADRGEVVWRERPFGARVLSIAFSPDGALLAVGGGSTPDELAAAEIRPLRVFTAATGAELAGFSAVDAFRSLAFAPGGEELLTGTDLARLLAFAPRDLAAPRAFLLPREDQADFVMARRAQRCPVRSIAVAPDGQTVYSVGGLDAEPSRGELRAWSYPEGAHRYGVLREGASMEAVDVAPDGRHLLVSTREGGVLVFATAPAE